MKYQNIEVEKVKDSESGKTSVFEIMSSLGYKVIGHVYWNRIYRGYSFFPISFSFFAPDVLCDIAKFLEDLKNGKAFP